MRIIWSDNLRANNRIAQRNMTRLGLGQISRNRETVTSCKANSILRGRGGDRWYQEDPPLPFIQGDQGGRGGDRWYQEAGVSDRGGRSGDWDILFICFFLFPKWMGPKSREPQLNPTNAPIFFLEIKHSQMKILFNIQRLENRFCYLPIQFLGIWWNGQILIRSGSIFKSKDGLINSPG